MSDMTPYEGTNGKGPPPLAERLDGSIGEASSMMGAVLTELVRRALRGGVNQIGVDLDDYARERVGGAVTAALPGVEAAAAAAAEHSARATAELVARQEVAEVDRHARETALALSDRLEQTGLAAREQADGVRSHLLAALAGAVVTAAQETQKVREDLSGRLEASRGELTGALETTRQELTGGLDAARSELTGALEATRERAEKAREELARQVEATGEAARDQTEQVRAALTGRIGEVEKKAEDQTQSAVTVVTAQIEETARRVTEATEATISRQVQDLLDSSRQATGKLKARLLAVEESAGELTKALRATEEKLRASMETRFEMERRALLERVVGLEEINLALAGRLAALERPRGLRRLWQWLFGARPEEEGKG